MKTLAVVAALSMMSWLLCGCSALNGWDYPATQQKVLDKHLRVGMTYEETKKEMISLGAYERQALVAPDGPGLRIHKNPPPYAWRGIFESTGSAWRIFTYSYGYYELYFDERKSLIHWAAGFRGEGP